MKKPEVDYFQLRINNIATEKYKHLLWLIYWCIFGFLFWYAEDVLVVDRYIVMEHHLDALIPFNELFVIPYLFWFIYMIGIHIYTALYDIKNFEKLMKYIAITYTIGLISFYLFPTCQLLRPSVMPRDNILTRVMAYFYTIDTHTNVCPSLHVVGSMAVMFTGWECKDLQNKKWRLFFGVTTFLISVATVFLKQHSIIDLAAGLLVGLIAYPFVFAVPEYPEKMDTAKKTRLAKVFEK